MTRSNRCRSSIAALGLLAALAAVPTGCGLLGYRLGTTLPPDIRSVHVPAFVNATREPQLEAETTRATIAELQRDGTLRIATADEADAVLTVTLTAVTEETLRFRRDRADTGEEFRLRIEGVASLTKRATGERVVADQPVAGRATFEFVGDMAASRQAALPDAARDLARSIVSALVEHW